MPSRDQGTYGNRNVALWARANRTSGSVSGAAAEEMLVAVRRHPFGAGEMALEGSPCAGGLLPRIDLKYDPRDLGPIRALGIGVEKTEIGEEVGLVISGQCVGAWSEVGNIRVEAWFRHRVTWSLCELGISRQMAPSTQTFVSDRYNPAPPKVGSEYIL
jgi:hypothetical protein